MSVVVEDDYSGEERAQHTTHPPPVDVPISQPISGAGVGGRQQPHSPVPQRKRKSAPAPRKPAAATTKKAPAKKAKKSNDDDDDDEVDEELDEEMGKQLNDNFIEDMEKFVKDDSDEEESDGYYKVYYGSDDEEDIRGSPSLLERVQQINSQALTVPREESEFEKAMRAAMNSSRQIIGLISILNIVVTAHLTCDLNAPYRVKHINLLDLVVHGSRIGFQLNKKRFAAAIVSHTNPTCCVLIFEKGKIVCAGCSNLKDANFAINKVVEMVSTLRKTYNNLHAIDVRVRNMVGKTCFPNTIDTKRLHRENQRAVENPIADGIKMVPPPNVVLDTDLDRKKNSSGRRSGSTLIYESGYVLIIGAASRHEIRRAYAYVYPILSKYVDGTATSAFSADKIRRYYTDLRTAYEASQKSPVSFIAVYNDGTEGTVQDWVEDMRVCEKLLYYRQLIDDPTRAMHNTLRLTGGGEGMDQFSSHRTLESNKSAEDDGSKALVVSARNENALVRTNSMSSTAGALINIAARNDDSLALVRASNDATKHTIRRAQAVRKVQDVIQRQSVALQVREHGAEVVAQAQKPKEIQVLSMEEASTLFSGHTRRRIIKH